VKKISRVIKTDFKSAVEVLRVEIDLDLNRPERDLTAIKALIAKAQEYLNTPELGVMQIEIISL
jgi:hypothetical protein